MAETEETFDAVLAARVQTLVTQVMDYSEEVMRSGSSKTKNDFIARVFPVLVRSLVNEERDADIDALRAAQQELFERLADSTPPALPPRPSVPEMMLDSPREPLPDPR